MNASRFMIFRRIQRGVGLIELMVAIVIGAVVSLAVFGVVSSFEGRKRTTTSVNDINQSGSYALYRIDKWVRSAGAGLSYYMDDGKAKSRYLFGCQIYANHATKGQLLPRTGALPAPFAGVNTGTANVFRLAPILIAPGQTIPGVSGSASDVLVVMGGVPGGSAVPMSFGNAISGAAITVKNTVGLNVDDLLLLADQGQGPTGPCFIEQVGALATGTITMGGNYYAAAFASGMSPSSLTAGALTMIGSVKPVGSPINSNPPYFALIGVGDNNTLFSYDLLRTNTAGEDNAATPIADGVFEMHALYGVDTNNDNVVDTWVSPSDAASNYTLAKLSDISDPDKLVDRINSIKAIRVGLILRTSLPEKTTATSYVGPAQIQLFTDLGAALTFTRSFTATQRAFRYRVVESTIPVRNTLIVKKSN